MFWFWAFASMFGYAVQNALIARYVRIIDPLSASFYRNVTFFISFLPVFFFVAPIDFLALSNFKWELLGACVLATISQWTRFSSFRYLPVGIASAGNMGFTVIFSCVWAVIYFSEFLNFYQLLCLIIILLGSIVLSITRSAPGKVKQPYLLKGFFMVMLTGFFVSLSLMLVTQISRDLNPFIAAYAWETGISLVTLLFIGGRKVLGGPGLQKISWQTFHQIFWCVSPTVLGTIGFVLAIKIGSFAIVSAISATSVIVITALGVWMYAEKLRPLHYGAILITVLGAVLLRLLS